jgi:hypothetical protein
VRLHQRVKTLRASRSEWPTFYGYGNGYVNIMARLTVTLTVNHRYFYPRAQCVEYNMMRARRYCNGALLYRPRPFPLVWCVTVVRPKLRTVTNLGIHAIQSLPPLCFFSTDHQMGARGSNIYPGIDPYRT